MRLDGRLPGRRHQRTDMTPHPNERPCAQRPLLTAHEVTAWLNVSLRTLDQIVAKGDLVTIRVRDRVRRFDPVQVEAYLRRCAKNR